jgi:hypothetical protein
MNRYIAQLIDDMRTAAAAAPPDPLEADNLPAWQAAEIEQEASDYFIHAVPQPLSTIVGIPFNMLPDSGRLSDQQLSKLVPEILDLLRAYNFVPDFPNGIPNKMLYDALRDIWNADNIHVPTGTVYIQFCQFDEEEHCPFPGYCDECHELTTSNEERSVDTSNKSEPHVPKDKSQLLDGIQNYCDRWCERCPFSSRCYVAVTEQTMNGLFEKYPHGNIPSEEMDNWPGDEEKEGGQEVDFDAEWTDDEICFDMEDDDFFSPRSKATRHPLIEQAGAFSKQMGSWLKKRYAELSDDLAPHFARGYSDEVATAEEVLSRFHIFILIKLQRAMIGLFDDENFSDGGRDMNGSARIALLTIDESLEALTLLIRTLKSHRVELKQLRQQLEVILTLAEAQFPEARAFIRPYHDQ